MVTQDFLKSIPLTASMEFGVERTWVVFEKSTTKRWFHRWCHPSRQHVWCLHYDGQRWYRIERLYNGVEFKHIQHIGYTQFDQACDLSYYYKTKYECIEVPREYWRARIDALGKMRGKFPVEFCTCVHFVKDFIGLDDYWVITPEQLYRRLKDK